MLVSKNEVCWLLSLAFVVGGNLIPAQSAAEVALPCVGDCNDDSMVSVSELITGVNILLGRRPVEVCLAFDACGNGSVEVNELIRGVNSALRGCDGAPPTATPTESASTEIPATETPTPAPEAERLAGAAAAVVNGVSSIPNLIAAVVAGFTGGSNAALSGLAGTGAGGVDTCELGGSVDSSLGFGGVDVSLSQCKVSRPDGGRALFDGILNIDFANAQDALALRGPGSFLATIDFLDSNDAVIATSELDLAADVDINPAPGGGHPCQISTPIGAQLIDEVILTDLEGPVSTEIPGVGLADVDFDGASVTIEVTGFGADCVPTDFVVLLNGLATISQDTTETSLFFDLTFDNFRITATSDGSGGSSVAMEGSLVADCFNGPVTLSTPQNLSFALGQFCPGSGTISVQDIGEIVFSQQGLSVGGMDFASCLDPALQSCEL